jgi:CobQ-like glutamine amidotransferase family enzyme
MAVSNVVIAVVRPSLLGTYGDGGNAIVLASRLARRGIGSEVLALEGGATVPEAVDICVLGGGEDTAQAGLAGDAGLGQSLTRAVERGVTVLAVCAGFQVLGREFAVGTGEMRPGFGIVDCITDARLPQRAVGELVARPAAAAMVEAGVPVLTGFENHGGRTRLGPGVEPLGVVERGVGNGDETGSDGLVSGRVVGTYLHGPVLARNPALADLLLSWTVGRLAPLDLPEVDRLRAERLAAAGRGGRAAAGLRRFRAR